ncbi:MAG: T9SS type A sorting domain-containing protein, partial [Candidatus Kapaibacteriota bacterium]
LDSASIAGTQDSLPFDTQIGKTYMCSYSVKIPAELNIQTLHLYGFVLDYNPDPLFGRVLNSISSPLRTSITTIEDKTESDELSIFPQPATDNVMIKGMLPEGIVTIEIHSMLGTLLMKEELHHSGDENFVLQPDISSFPSGIYLISLKANGKHIQQSMRIVR